MFTDQVQGILSQLAGILPQPAIDAMIQVFGNCAQAIDHRGPVNFQVSGDQPALTLANNGVNPVTRQEQPALNVAAGTTNIGGPLTVNAPATFNDPATFTDQAIFNDDIVFSNADLILKYCNAGFGSTVARVKVKGPQDENGNYPGQIVDCNGDPVGSNASGQNGDGSITMKDCSQSTAKCSSEGDCGFAIYMSDCDPNGGAEADCTNRTNNGHWEIIKLNKSFGDQGVCEITYVSDVCCVNGTLIVCKKTVTFPEPVIDSGATCTGGMTCNE